MIRSAGIDPRRTAPVSGRRSTGRNLFVSTASSTRIRTHGIRRLAGENPATVTGRTETRLRISGAMSTSPDEVFDSRFTAIVSPFDAFSTAMSSVRGSAVSPKA